MKRKIFLCGLISLLLTFPANAVETKTWHNDLRTLFLNNQANIMEINIRNFFAYDKNKNGIIDIELGELSGNFLNNYLGLKELSKTGINTVHVLPITPVGKIKALGTAGSLYALSSFNEINPQLLSSNSNLTPEEQLKFFIDNCHKFNIRVIIDLPSCGSYDYYLSNPDLFEKDSNDQPIIPADWTDVRVFKSLNSNGEINQELLNLHKSFIDMILKAGADGLRADVATIKPFKFWQELIQYTRTKSPQFLFLAEASDSWKTPPSNVTIFTPYDKLLEAGFDGFYSSYFNFKDFTDAKQLVELVNRDRTITQKYKEPKSVIASFMTHDEQSPILLGGENYATTLIWLNALLPLNAYFVDGIHTGDNYLYDYANKIALKTYTDDNTYYVHNGKFDIFNFSRLPGGKNLNIARELMLALTFKKSASTFLQAADFKTLPSSNSNIHAYSRCDGSNTLIFILNKNLHAKEKASIKVKKLSQNTSITPIKLVSIPQVKKNNINVELEAGELQVLYVTGLKI